MSHEEPPTANPIEITEEYSQAIQAFEENKSPVWITGKAGTGKSTLLRYLVKKYQNSKKIVVFAPTGMAALNIGGQTIHSFFNFPPTLMQKQKIKINNDKLDLIRNIDAIIIDEISMVRADLIDGIDIALKLYRCNKNAFGGVQVLFFGDICQLPPVVPKDLEDYFLIIYETPYFFSSHILRKQNTWVYNLCKVFRQSDHHFIEILDRIRMADVTLEDLIEINKRSDNSKKLTSLDLTITLAITNKIANSINQNCLETLDLPELRSEAILTGRVDLKSLPSPQLLTLRKGAEIIMTKNNNPFWVNGSIGYVKEWNGQFVRVIINENEYLVEKETWKFIEYDFSEQDSEIKETVVGTYF